MNKVINKPAPIPPKHTFWNSKIVNIFLVICGITLFLFSIDLVGNSVNRLGSGAAESILLATSNPFISLFIGLLITAMIQSSSTSTSMIVAVVASGTLSFSNAIPMIMGANIGTTLTSTIVSLGYITKKKEFRKAIAAGTIHDFFNIFITIILFPLEYYYGILSFLASNLTNIITPDNFSLHQPSFSISNFILNPASDFLFDLLPYNLLVLAISLILLFLSIKILSVLIYKNFIGEFSDRLKKFVFKKTYKAFSFGMVLTAGVQSSSITTSLIVPLVATGKITLKRAFPFIMGANIGTTITALLAALFRSDAAISIALAHLIFNFIGVLIFLPFSIFRKIPILLAAKFGRLTIRFRLIGFAYIIFTFFLLPFTLIYLTQEEKQTGKNNKAPLEEYCPTTS
ncbi:Na/Pi symporter [soil metagenome]